MSVTLTSSTDLAALRKKATDTHKKGYAGDVTKESLEAYQTARTDLITALQGNVEYWRDHLLQMTTEESDEDQRKAQTAVYCSTE